MTRRASRRLWTAALACAFALALALGTALLPTQTAHAQASDPYKCTVTGITALASDKSNVPSAKVDNRNDTGWLDFTDPDNLPDKDAAGGKWSWDGTTNTLTLEDGFSVSSAQDDGTNHDGAIILPDDSTIKVNGTANVFSGYRDGIYCRGDLAVELGKGAQLIIDAEVDRGIYAGDLTISSAAASSPGTISINAALEGIQCGAFTAKNSTLEITSESEDGIYAYDDLTATNCIFSITAQRNCLGSLLESISLTNCESVLRANYNVNYNVIDAEKDITVTGGSLYAVSESNDVIYVVDGSISITDAKLDLTCADGHNVIKGGTLTSLSIGAPFRLYDANGGELYQGSYSSSLLTTDDNGCEVLTVSGVSPTRLVSTFTVTFADENGTVLSTQTVDWQSAATAPAAPKKDGYTFAGWDTDFSSVQGDLTVKATYMKTAIPEYAITAVGGEGGTITPSGSTSVKEGGSLTLTIAANDGYKILDVLVDGQSVGAVSSYTFTNVTAAHTIEAKFEKDANSSGDDGSGGGASGSTSAGSGGSASTDTLAATGDAATPLAAAAAFALAGVALVAAAFAIRKRSIV